MPSTDTGRGPARVLAVSPVQLVQRRTGRLLLIVVLGHVMLISAQVTTRSGASVLEAVTFAAFSEVQRAASWALGGAATVWARYVALRGVQQDNERLEREVAALQVQLQQEHTRSRRADRLELLLGLQRAATVPTLAAEVIAGDPTASFRTVTINKGARDGVRADMAVISARGVVGRVIDEPAARAARVQLLIDRTAGAGALVERSGAGGIVMGDDGRTRLRMEYVSSLADLVPGDVVVTSGLDGIFPKGFVIGTVTEVVRGAGIYRTVRLRPAVDFSSVEDVLVVLDAGLAPAGSGGGT